MKQANKRISILTGMCFLVATTNAQAVKPVKKHPATTSKKISLQKGVISGGALPTDDGSTIRLVDSSYTLTKQGDLAVKQGNWVLAKSLYQQAQVIWPTNDDAFYGLGKCADHDGDLQTAIADYSNNINSHSDHVYGTVPGDGYATNDDVRLLEFAILLSRAGRVDDAVNVYNRGIGFRNYEDGEQNTPVLFPTFGSADSQVRYNPQLLQAMAHASIATREIDFDDLSAASHAQQASSLAPTDGIVQFYVAQSLNGVYMNFDNKPLPQTTLAQYRAAAMIAYQKASNLGNNVVKAAVKQVFHKQ